MSNITDNLKIQVLKAGCSGIFTNYIYKAIPLAFDESMSYYETLAGLLEYLKDVILPTVNGNAEAVAELQELYIQLNDYVTNYFDNLDVQEEINNKLDEMVEDGTIESILLNYSQVTKVYDTYNDMIFDTSTFVNGMKLKTLGYHFINDGGGADYVVTNVQNENKYQVSIGTNLWVEMIIKDSVNVKQFGAYGDAQNDDTQAIQKALDYCFKKGIKVIIPETNNYYKITKPLILNIDRTTTNVGYWGGYANTIVGTSKAKSRIVKIGTLVHEDNPNSNINNKNATLLCINSTTSTNTGTGVTIDNLSIENYSNSELEQVADSYAIYTNISRSNYTNLNIISYSGINGACFSSLFENIVFKCINSALYLTNGTSNLFRFMYAPNCINPYHIQSQYSSLINVCCDNAKGNLFEISGMGLSLISCGCESKNATNIFKILSDFSSISIRDFYMIRQVGDVDNNINVEDCSIVYSEVRSDINIENISIAETEHIEGTSYFFNITNNLNLATSLKNIRYYKNYTGTDNDKIKLWKNQPALKCIQRLSTPTMEFNYLVNGNKKIVPYIGGYKATGLTDIQGNCINSDDYSFTKSIWLDAKTKYTSEDGSDIRYSSSHNKGDIQLYNDPLLMNSLGLSITNVVNSYTWDTVEIPIVLKGTTENRPTTNLFVGLQYFDTTLKLPIYWNGAKWIKADGTDA